MEREREREIYGRGETKVSDSEGVRREKVKEIVFQKKKIGKEPIENELYFY